jgi:predicted ATPase/class 3 adenylate cyclase/Tfp pilus assembly protein PilF
MNLCPQCGFQNPDGIHICLNCASSIKLKCQKCNADIPFGNRFCGQCGAPLETTDVVDHERSAPSPSNINLQDRMLRDLRAKMPSSMMNKLLQESKDLFGQRREVTVLQIEIANFRSISQELDSETIYLAIDEIVQLLADVVYKYEGTIDKYSGNGMMALFGLPINHENDPERTVRAALEMQFNMSQLRDHLIDQYHYDFQIQIGINTGAVIAGHMSDQQHLEYTVIGDSVRLASQLQKYANPGNILVSFSTYQRTRPIFDYQSVPPLQAEEISEPIKVFQPLGVRLTSGQLRGLPGLQVPMIGRNEQLDELIKVFNKVIDTNSSEIVLCSGEAGIGKSRLVAEFRNYLAKQSTIIIQGTCALYMRITPYRVLADVLRNILGISELDPVNEQRKTLQRHLDQFGADHSDILPYLMHVLGILHSDPLLEVRIKLLDPSMLRRQTHFALRMFFIAESRRSPIVFVFDDLHWIDQPSGEFLEYLCQSLEASPILLVMVARDFEKYSFAESIRTAAHKHIRNPHEIYIQPLTDSDAHLLVDQLVQEDTKPAKEMKAIITARAGGNPYYTEELVRILMDHGGLINWDGNWHLTASAANLIHEIPGTLGDIILARFDHLSDDLKNVLLYASVLGDSFSIRLLQSLMMSKNENLSNSLKELEERDFLIYTKFDFEEGYIFKHPLIPETIYKTLLKRDSKKLHSQVAQVIESGDFWLPGERNQVLAYHLSESTEPARAIPYLLISAEKAYQHFANDTVVQLYRQVLQLMEKVASPSKEQKEKVQVGLAQALKFTGELEEAARLLLDIVDQIPKSVEEQQYTDNPSFQIQIEALCELADLRAREGNLDYAVQILKRGMDLLSEAGKKSYPTIWRRLADRLAWVFFRQRNLDEAHNLVDMALLDTATWETEDPITMASLYNTIGGIYWTRSRFADAIESVEHSLEIYKNLNYHWGMANSLANLGILHYSTEKWSQAVEYLEQADKLRREYGDDPERPINLKNLGEVLIDLGDYQRARSNLETSRKISQRLGLNISQAYAEFGLCRLALVEGNPSDARLHVQIAGALLESLVDSNDRVASYYQLQAQIEIENGDFQQAKAFAEQALSISQRGSISEKVVDALRVLGTISAKTGEFEQSETYLYHSIELAQQLNDRFSEAKARYEMGQLFWLWSAKNASQQKLHLEQATRSMDAAIRIFEALGAQHDLFQAKNNRLMMQSPKYNEEKIKEEAEIEKQTNLLRAQLHLPEGEWYQATIISAILIPKPGADEELIFETIALLIPPLTELIKENGCQILNHEDGITAILGAPAAHEDDPERAIDTVIQIVNFFTELDQQTELSVSLHLGVSMGKIVAGEAGIGQSCKFMASGEPVQIARTIAEACPSGRVWVTESIKHRTSYRFEYSPLPSNIAEIFPVANTIFQLEGLREQILPVRGLIGLKTPFIGRDKELNEMESMSQVLKGKTGGIIWIEGEAGIGKSRLMREFTKQVVKYKALTLNGICTSRHSEYAFSLFSDVLMQVFEIQHQFTPKEINEQIDHKIFRWSSELADVRPFLQLVMGVQPSGEQGERITSMEPEQLRRQTFVAIHRLFSILALRQPLVFILDDLQWIDSISADLLLYLSHLIVSRPIMFVCAQRQNEISSFEPVLTRIRSMHPDQCLQLTIKPLTITECRLLLNEFLSSADLPDTFLSLIIQQSGGNPYFIEEFVRLLVEKDFLRLVRGKLVANRSIKAEALIVPASLESLIRARVDSLEISARHLLQIASVIGLRFSGALLAQVAEREDVNLILSHLHARGMLNLTTEEDYWEFSHPLIELIVYNSVLKAQRRILHHRTAIALENKWHGTEDEHAEDLAYHFRKAEILDRALQYLIIAGERAAARHANDGAVSFFEQAAELMSVVPNIGDEARWRIINQMGEVYQFIGKYDTSLAVLQSGLDLLHSDLLSPAQRAGIYRRMGDTAHKKGDQEQAIIYLNQALEVINEPQDTPSRIEAARIYARLGWCHFLQSDFDSAKDAVMKSMHHAGLAKNLTTLAMAENYLGGILFRQGELEQAMQHTRTAMDYWQEIGYSWGVAAALSNLGILESESGNWQAAFNSIKRSLELRQKMGDVDGVAITNHNLGHLVHSLGDVAEAEKYYRDSLAVSRPLQMNWHAANSFVGLAQSLLCQGKIDEASDSIQESFRLAREINAPDVIIEAYCTLTEISLARGSLPEAEESGQNAVKLASQIGVSPLLATAWRLISASLLRQGKVENSRQALENAWKALAESPDKLEEGRLHIQAMLIALDMNDVENARFHHSSAEQLFKGLGALRDLSLMKTIEIN